MNLEETIIYIYLRVDQKYRDITACYKIRGRGFAPALTDVEVLTMEIVARCRGVTMTPPSGDTSMTTGQSGSLTLGHIRTLPNIAPTLSGSSRRSWLRCFPPMMPYTSLMAFPCLYVTTPAPIARQNFRRHRRLGLLRR